MTKLEFLNTLISEGIYINNELNTSCHEIRSYFKNMDISEMKQDVQECESSGYYFSISTCDYNECDGILWLADSDTPDDIVMLEDGEYSLTDNAVYAYTGRYQEYISSDIDHWEYDNEYYTHEGMQYHNLILDNHGYVINLDQACFCVDIDNYVHEDDCHYNDDTNEYYYYESSMPQKGMELKGYHNSRYKNKTTKDTLISVGFEIEKEDIDILENGDINDINNVDWDAEKDSSLGDGGYELVSAIYDLNNTETMFSDFEEISNYINADFTDNCGGHINIRHASKDKYQFLESFKGYIPLIYAMYPKRVENTYCNSKKISEMGCARYEAINMTKSNNIIELRIFRAVKNVEMLKFRVKFLQNILKKDLSVTKVLYTLLNPHSELTQLLRTVYTTDNYEKLIDRVVNYTDLYFETQIPKYLETKIQEFKINLITNKI